MLRLVRSRFVDVKVTRLCIGKFGELSAELLQLQSCDLFVEVFWQHIDADRVLVGAGVEFDLRQGLVGKGGTHHVRGMAGATAQVHEATLGQQDDTLAIGKDDMVNLRLDVLPGVFSQRRDIDLVVEMPDVADDRLVLHRLHVLVR